MPLHVAFLWHMHQPYYVDPVRNTAVMPWVRLHATKGYLDMIWLVEQFPEFRCTFNLTPVLVKQIQQLAARAVGDAWQDLAAVPADTLTMNQRVNLLKHFFKANREHMIEPYPRYRSLLHRRGLNPSRSHLDQVADSFTTREWRDLQVWFNLTWFGYAAERLYPEIVELKRKGEHFSESDKQIVLNRQHDVLQRLLDDYGRAAGRGQIELSTTPFFHPILPLVYNTEFAQRCMPGRQRPRPFSRPEDVHAQLLMAREFHTEVFGAAPHGLWPSEGSVCPELIPILQELGFQWFATDEEVLWRSLNMTHSDREDHRSLLFQGYQASFGDANMYAVFRDRRLSDFIGFTASRNTPVHAAQYLAGQLEQIGGTNSLCTIVLDGENAWEHFPDGGQSFLRELYARLSTHSGMKTTTLHEYFLIHPPQTRLAEMHTGSWINADFDIWIGHSEENRAWELLSEARNYVEYKANHGELIPDQVNRAMAEIYAAEGSDWFWWYGDDFFTENDVIFDDLFRTHLQNVYRIIGSPMPDILNTPICRLEQAVETQLPTDLIHPEIDGQITSYYEWIGAGLYQPHHTMTTMYRTEQIVEAIHYGFDLERFFLRIDFRQDFDLSEGMNVRLTVLQPKEASLTIGPVGADRKSARCTMLGTNASEVAFAVGKIVELGVPFALLGLRASDELKFFIELVSGEVSVERHPLSGVLAFSVPDKRFETEHWRV